MNDFKMDLICSQEWKKKDLEMILNLAKKMKQERYLDAFTKAFMHKNF